MQREFGLGKDFEYQNLLEINLKSQFSKYKPTIILQQCVDYQNWSAVAVIYSMLGEWPEALGCKLRSIPPDLIEDPNFIDSIRHYFLSIISDKDIDQDQMFKLLGLLVDFWYAKSLDCSILQAMISDNEEKLIVPFSQLLLIDKIPPLSFTASFLFNVCRTFYNYQLDLVSQQSDQLGASIFLSPSHSPFSSPI